jgi:hypothetical protein
VCCVAGSACAADSGLVRRHTCVEGKSCDDLNALALTWTNVALLPSLAVSAMMCNTALLKVVHAGHGDVLRGAGSAAAAAPRPRDTSTPAVMSSILVAICTRSTLELDRTKMLSDVALVAAHRQARAAIPVVLQ